MRKLLIVALVLLLSVPVFAGDATMKGTWTLGSGVNSAGGAGTSIGYFYMDNIEFGGGFAYGSNDNAGTTTSNMGLAVGATYYLSEMGPGQPYGHAALGYNSWDNGATTGSGQILDLGAGYQMFLQDNIAWGINLGYEMGMGDYDYSSLSLGVGLKVFVF